MKILFISYLSQPSDRIGAVRPSNMVQWLAAYGHELSLITANSDAPGRFDKTVDVHVVGHSAPIQRAQDKLTARAKAKKAAGEKPHSYIIPVGESKQKRLFSREMFYSIRLWLWTWLCQQDWAFRCRRHIRINLKKEYDVVLSCFGPIGCLLLGRWAYKRGYGRAWVSDMRDPIANVMQSPAEHWYSVLQEHRTLREADRIVMVSQGEAEYFRSLATKERDRQKVTCLENGYEVAESAGRNVSDHILRIVYTGQLYGDRSNATALMKVLRELAEQKLAVELHYAGPHSYSFIEMARRCGAEAVVIDHGMLPRDQALALQEKADILCVLTWNDDSAAGHLPGKFWEYLRVGKPILSMCSGAVPGAELTRRVQELGVGFAYEYAAPDDAGLEAFVRRAAMCKITGDAVPYTPDAEKVLDYRYDRRALFMAEICRQTLTSKEIV